MQIQTRREQPVKDRARKETDNRQGHYLYVVPCFVLDVVLTQPWSTFIERVFAVAQTTLASLVTHNRAISVLGLVHETTR